MEYNYDFFFLQIIIFTLLITIFIIITIIIIILIIFIIIIIIIIIITIGMESLIVTPISKAAANQRAGRAGNKNQLSVTFYH
jgi:hypothetical protein